jgi:uncharacterized protein (TIGR00369 family)
MSDRFTEAPISKLIGFHVQPATEQDSEIGRAVVELDIDERLNNPMGRVHGGVLAALSDAAMGIAFGRTLQSQQDFSTIDLHIHFMRPVRGKKLIATGTMIQRGLRIGFLQCTITDDRGREVASSSCSCTILMDAALTDATLPG